MSNSYFQILPQNLIQQFYYSFSIYGLLLHFHSMTKDGSKFPLTVTYNFSAFLTLDKSRKIIRKKEDEFVAEMVRRVEQEAKLLVSKHSDEKELYKITYTELQKFIELFEGRKSQFLYFEKSVTEIEKLFGTDDKQRTKNEQTIKKMKDTMDEFYEKLAFVLKKYEQKTHVALVGKLRTKMTRKFSDLQESQLNRQNKDTDEFIGQEGNRRMVGIYKIESETPSQNTLDNPSSFKRSVSKKKTKVLSKFGDVSVQNSKIQKLKREILKLRTKYHKMNCKTQISYTQNEPQIVAVRKQASRTHTFQTCAESDAGKSNTFAKDQETNASEVKYSIRLTQEKKQSKMNSSSFSIFDKKTHHASFILKNVSKVGYERSAIIDELEQTQKSIPGEFIRKRSSLFKNPPNNFEGIFPKKAINSVYRQTNFAVEAQQKAHQKRVSTAKPKQSARLQTDHKQYLLRTSQTEANIEEDFDPKEEINFDNEEVNDDVVPVEEEKILPRLQEDENEVQLIFNKEKDKKSNNRRKGFSKKNITSESEFETNFAPSTVSVKRISQIWSDTSKPQKPYNRTSFFRSSGYTPKKSMMKPKKAGFNNLSKKLCRHESKDFSSQAVIQQVNTQKTIKAKGLQRDRAKKGIRANEMAITAKDCKQLFQEINGQCKLDEKGLHPSYFLTMMRQKYDLRYKSRQEDEQNDDVYNPFRNQLMNLIETEDDEEEGVGKWNSCAIDKGEVQFMRNVVRKYNELGQKDLGVCVNSWEDELECINL